MPGGGVFWMSTTPRRCSGTYQLVAEGIEDARTAPEVERVFAADTIGEDGEQTT